MIHPASRIILRDTAVENRLPGVTYLSFEKVHYLEFNSTPVDELYEFLNSLDSHVIVPDRLQSCLDVFVGIIGFTNAHDAVKARMIYNTAETISFDNITLGFRPPC